MWVKQRGSDIGYRLILATYKIIGYGGAKFIIWFVSLFYAIVTKDEREAMKDYYRRVGVSYSFGYYLSHINQFSLSIFDRFVAKLDPDIFEIQREDRDKFLQKDKNQSRIVALSHLGNWANTFVAFKYDNHVIHILTNEKLKESIVEYEKSLKYQYSSSVKTINLREGLKATLQMVEAFKKGEDVAIMVDRLVDKEKFVNVDFLNSATKFNRNPFEIAYNRGLPIIGVTVIRTGDKRYKLFFSDVISIDKSTKKEKAIEIMANQYAKYLEEIVKQYPKQWFNFYKFWEN
ncbi:MAG: lysophospholipid acyltransferase family protein [Epsilonproteobacteria bacterium]|nr:lysophospholipid acyltransferase family protein [Campylobacterota bacterium]